jgi:hypothetical protein
MLIWIFMVWITSFATGEAAADLAEPLPSIFQRTAI